MAFAELRMEVVVMLGRAPMDVQALLDHTWSLIKALRRRARHDPDEEAARAAMTVERVLARVRGTSPHTAEVLLLETQVHTLARGFAERDTPAPLRRAGIGLLARVARADEAQVLADALDSGDGRVRQAACQGLARLGADALEVLLHTSRYARKSARAAAARLLADMRLSDQAIERAVDRELEAMGQTMRHLGLFARLAEPRMVRRRLFERLVEAGHALFLMLGARVGHPGVELIARRYLDALPRVHEPDADQVAERAADGLAARLSEERERERARSLEALDALLPRALASRVMPVFEALPGAARGASMDETGDASSALEAAVDQELESADPLTRALVLHALGADGRANHRDAIFAAAEDAARDADPRDLLARLLQPAGAAAHARPKDDDMPRFVDTVLALGRISLFSELSTRELGELARSVEWRQLAPGECVVRQGEVGDALYFVYSGRVRVDVVPESDPEAQAVALGELGPGEPFGEMALFEDQARSATVAAVDKTRVGRITRQRFEHLVDEMPRVALAICRVLGRRLRARNPS